MYIFISEFQSSDEFLDLDGNDRLIFVLDQEKLDVIRTVSDYAGEISRHITANHCYLGFGNISLFCAEMFLAFSEDIDLFIAANRSGMHFINEQGSTRCYEVPDVDLVMSMYGIESDFDTSGGVVKVDVFNNIFVSTSIDNSSAEIFTDMINLEFLK